MKLDKDLFIYVLEQVNILGTFIEGKDEYAFLNDPILKDACLMKLLVIGEYAS